MFGPIKRKPKEKENPAEKLREQEETARVYAEFVKSFQVEEEEHTRRFVRGGVIDPNKTVEEEESAKSRLGKPQGKKGLWLPPPSESLRNRSTPSSTSDFSAAAATPHSSANVTKQSLSSSTTKSVLTAPTTPLPQTTLRTELGQGIGGLSGLISNGTTLTPPSSSAQKTREIDTFLEEIKKKQELLDQRKQLRQMANSTEEPEREAAKKKLQIIEEQTKGRGSIPGVVEAEETSNLYLGNLSPEITEEFLCQQFGAYGKITSVKIMYPRSEEERARRRHCGFVSFEKRSMAEAAKNNLEGQEFFGMPIRIGWGKAVPRSSATTTLLGPCVAPLTGIAMTIPPPRIRGSSGFSDVPPEKSTVKANIIVKIPKNIRQRVVIDMVAQYVAEDGHSLEQIILDREANNELFRFMFENDTEAAIYYRWRVYSLAQGDTLAAWRTEPYPMFFGCREWRPPSKDQFEDIRPERRSNFSDSADPTLVASSKRSNAGHTESGRGTRPLEEETRRELEDILRNLTRERSSILTAMAFCLDHSESAIEIAERLMQSLTIESTPVDTKISRLYLLSDILHNTSSSRQPAWAYRSAIERHLPEIFNHHGSVLQTLNGRLTIQAMKDRVMNVLRIWEDWAIYPPLFTKGLETSFLKEPKLFADVISSATSPLTETNSVFDPELDGHKLPDAETLSKYPFWLRKSLKEWKSLDISCLEALCTRRGLSIHPEALNADEKNKIRESNTQYDMRVNSIPSYSNVRELLVRRLIECEAYCRNRQMNINSQPKTFLNTTTIATGQDIQQLVSPVAEPS